MPTVGPRPGIVTGLPLYSSEAQRLWKTKKVLKVCVTQANRVKVGETLTSPPLFIVWKAVSWVMKVRGESKEPLAK